ncbi:hypothetical protein QR680_012363 [Steinernema hermaphroditum]|uniref:Uncharacterized protein n=1 Tax=Steinernema hermaphroditum TaxID=289476 RepID=A0AA39I1T2_9BILA|nr:hypothetical protein QR680_012363 [Steinernema hermaphroditum]
MCNIIKKKSAAKPKPPVDASTARPVKKLPPKPLPVKSLPPKALPATTPHSNIAPSPKAPPPKKPQEAKTSEIFPAQAKPTKSESKKTEISVQNTQGSSARSRSGKKTGKAVAVTSQKKTAVPTLISRRNERNVDKTQEQLSSMQKSIAPQSRIGDICFQLPQTSVKKKVQNSPIAKTPPILPTLPKPPKPPKSPKPEVVTEAKAQVKAKPPVEEDTVYQKKLMRQRSRTTTSSSERPTEDATVDGGGDDSTQDDESPECYMWDDDDIVFVCHDQIAELENEDLARLEDIAATTPPFTKWNPLATVEEMEDRHLFTRGVLTSYTLTSTGMTFPNQNDLAEFQEGAAKNAVPEGPQITFVDYNKNDIVEINKDQVLLKKPVKDHTMSLSENATMPSNISRLVESSKIGRTCATVSSVYEEEPTVPSIRSSKTPKSITRKPNTMSRSRVDVSMKSRKSK